MRKWLLLAATLVWSIAALAQEKAPDWKWTKLGKGVQYSAVQTELFGRTAYISAVRYKAHRHRTQICDAEREWADSTSALGQKMGAIAALNGSYFNVQELTPVTYLKIRGKRIASTTAREFNLRTDGVIGFKSNGGVRIFACDTLEYDLACMDLWNAIAAGPVLLRDSKPARESWPKNSFYTKHHPRTLMGVDKKNRVYMIVIDGRFPGEGDGASIDETVQVAQMFGLVDAINLDGGGSCALWTPQTGVLSHPYDNHRFDHYGQRIVPNILYIR